LKRYPNPTSTGAANNFTRIGTENTDQNQFDARLDHRFSSKDQIYGRLSFAKDLTAPVTPLPDGSGSITTGVTGLTDTRAHSFAANYIHVLNSRTLNELRIGYTRRSIDREA